MKYFLIGVILLCGCATFPSAQVRQTYVDSHPSLPKETRQAILEGKIRIGMTKDEVKASWGECFQFCNYPQSNICTSFGCTETYNCCGYYFTFTNSVLESFAQFNY